MALSLRVEQDDGVVTEYHRIACLTQHVNVRTIVEVESYTSQAKREEERSRTTGAVDGWGVYTSTRFVSTEYDEGMDVPGAYGYLKTLPEFAGAEDC